MIKTLIWMFQTKKFEEHFIYLVITGLIFMGLVFWISLMTVPLCTSDTAFIIVYIILLVLLTVPFLHITGYFWYLTENIISRREDISADCIYNGKINKKEVIELPELNMKKFIWRGIASVTASLLLYVPFVLLFCIAVPSISYIAKYLNWTTIQTSIFYISIVTIIIFILPALLWNYARRDSVFAVWNIFVAIDIIGNYTGRYFKNAILFLGYSTLYTGIAKLITAILGFSITSIGLAVTNSHLTICGSILLPFIILLAINYIIGIYWLFVNAYILGTIVPINEGY